MWWEKGAHVRHLKSFFNGPTRCVLFVPFGEFFLRFFFGDFGVILTRTPICPPKNMTRNLQRTSSALIPSPPGVWFFWLHNCNECWWCHDCLWKYKGQNVTVMPNPSHPCINTKSNTAKQKERISRISKYPLHCTQNFKRYPGSRAQILFRHAGHSETECIQRPFPVHAMNFVLAISRHKWI